MKEKKKLRLKKFYLHPVTVFILLILEILHQLIASYTLLVSVIL